MALPCSFEYVKPNSIAEAARIFENLSLKGKNPIYYAGGTEIISLMRSNQMETKALIDIKGIPECRVLEYKDGQLVIGAGIELSQLVEWSIFPLLSETLKDSADHTSRNKITVGGNICSQMFYKEAILPFLLSDSKLLIAGKDGVKTYSIHDVFHSNLQLNSGEFLVQIIVDGSYLSLPYIHFKKTKQGKIDYPLITVSALKKDDQLRFAFSGIYDSPFRSATIDETLNNKEMDIELKIHNVMEQMPGPFLNDYLGSGQFRMFLLKNLLLKAFETLKE